MHAHTNKHTHIAISGLIKVNIAAENLGAIASAAGRTFLCVRVMVAKYKQVRGGGF